MWQDWLPFVPFEVTRWGVGNPDFSESGDGAYLPRYVYLGR